MREVDRLRQIGLHPSFGRRLWIGRITDIDERHRPIGRRTNDLPWTVSRADKADMQSLGLIHHLPQRHLEQRRVDGAADFQVFGKIICRARTRRWSERTRFPAGHPTEEEDYSPVFLRLVAVLVARRATTNTSSCVPFVEASYAADFILNQQNLLRMHNQLVKQERSGDMVA